MQRFLILGVNICQFSTALIEANIYHIIDSARAFSCVRTVSLVDLQTLLSVSELIHSSQRVSLLFIKGTLVCFAIAMDSPALLARSIHRRAKRAFSFNNRRTSKDRKAVARSHSAKSSDSVLAALQHFGKTRVRFNVKYHCF